MSKRIDISGVVTPRTDEDLDRLLEALVYLVAQRQMRERWQPRRSAADRA